METRGPGDATRLAAEALGADAIVAVGGDGTMNEVANGLDPRGAPPIGMVPSGNANVLAKELGVPRDPEALARMIAEGREVAWDLGVEGRSGRRFLLFASAGFDAQVVHDFHRRRSGPITMADYAAWGLRTFTEFRIPSIRVEVDGVVVADGASWAVISNVRNYGGPLVFTPRAKFDDGAFEAMIQRRRHRLDTIHLFGTSVLAWATGIEARPADVTFHSARRVRLESSDGVPVALQIDGEPAGFLPAELDLRAGGLTVLGPALGR